MNKEKQRKKIVKIIDCVVLIAFISVILPSTTIQADTSFSDQLANAILADPSCLVSSSYSDTDTSYDRQAIILSNMGTMNATDGNTFVLLSSGVAGATFVTSDAENPGSERGEWFAGGQYPDFRNPIYDRATLSMNLIVPNNMHYVYYDCQLFSTEYPEYVGDVYNDKFTVTVYSPTYGTDSFYIDVNSGHFVLDSNSIAGTGFDIFARDSNPNNVDWVDNTPRNPGADAGASALYTEGGHPVSPNEQITITFEIKDEYDNQFDSSIFIDNLRFVQYARPDIEARKEVQDINGGITRCGDILQYSISISNTGFFDQLNNPGNEMEDFIPENTAYVSGSASATSGSVQYDANDELIYWNGEIESDSSVVISYQVKVNQGITSNTLISNQAEIFWDKDYDGTNEEYLPTNWANKTIHNSPPVANNDQVTTEEDTLLNIDVLANDYDPSDLDIEIYNYSEPEIGNITLKADGTIDYIPHLNYYGQDSFEYVIIHSNASPNEDEIDNAEVTITITPVNDPPEVDSIPGQSICNGENFMEIDLDDYVYDPDNLDEEITWSMHTARTLWRNIETGQIVASSFLDWVDISSRIATVTYPSDPSEWGKPNPPENYESAINGSLFVFKPQFNAMDPGGLVDYSSSVGNFTLYPTFDHPDFVTETFADDESGGSASQEYDGRLWFTTGSDDIGCNFEVSSASQFVFNSINSFKTKIRNDGSPLTWYYTLDTLDCDITAWEIWMYCGRTSEYSDLKLDFKNGDQESIAKISVDYTNTGQAPLSFVPRVKYWDGATMSVLEQNLAKGWYKLRIERNETGTVYKMYGSDDILIKSISKALNEPFSDLEQIRWSSSKNAIVCPMLFWDDHVIELEPLS